MADAQNPFKIRQRGHSAPVGPEITVLRALPLVGLKAIGPFVFLDHGGPMPAPEHGIGAHPHAGIEVITYLIQGENEHRDSFGHRGLVTAGGVQWITAGRGMLHAEKPSPGVMELVQLWTRHPRALDDQPMRYQAVQSDAIREVVTAGHRIRLICGALPGLLDEVGPVQLAQQTLLAHVTLQPGASLELPLPEGQEAGIYVLHGEGSVGGVTFAAGEIGLLNEARAVQLTAGDTAFDVMLLGGQAAERPLVFSGPFVFNSEEAIARAKADFVAGRMGVLDGVPIGVAAAHMAQRRGPA